MKSRIACTDRKTAVREDANEGSPYTVSALGPEPILPSFPPMFWTSGPDICIDHIISIRFWLYLIRLCCFFV